jgi:prepilin-type N-terminal cleavage/methylation domain-containing protein
MMKKMVHNISGFSLIEVVVVIVVMGIVAAIAMKSMTSSLEDMRRIETEREMEMLAAAIVGQSDFTGAGARSDFGYIGDVGAFPPDLQALYQNPGGYATWNGPYIEPGFTQDAAGYRTDDWGQVYTYTGGITITSNGGGSPITHQFAKAASDYLLNTFNGNIKDANDSVPGITYMDSVAIRISIPDGAGGTLTKYYSPDALGAFTLDALPVGTHPVRFIYTPANDTLLRYVTILPRHKSSSEFKFAYAYFGGGGSGGGCTGTGTYVLRPNQPGTRTQLDGSGCGDNWECVDENTADGDATKVRSTGGAEKTDTYGIGDPPADTCNIIRMTVYCRVRKLDPATPGYVKATIRTGGNQYEGPVTYVSSTYEDYNYDWVNNPGTGAAWTWTEIGDLEAGISLKTDSPADRGHCTQVWVEVEYGP